MGLERLPTWTIRHYPDGPQGSSSTNRLFDVEQAAFQDRPTHHYLVTIPPILFPKDPLVDHRPQRLRMRLDRLYHLLQLDPAARKDRPCRKHLGQAPLEAHLVVARPAGQEADDGDDAAHPDGRDALLHLVDAGHLDDDVDAAAAGERLGRLAPFAVVLVADDVVGAESLQGGDFAASTVE
ncbi:hypothetical protein MKX08_009798 [Trichoderma sp. CBMAI-0020]|nr:hypothetical protein MKX08_009798 [Trichoderma sp. CBMAI-0020]